MMYLYNTSSIITRLKAERHDVNEGTVRDYLCGSHKKY